MFPLTSSLQSSNKQENPIESSHFVNVMSPIKPAGNQQKRASQQNVTPFTKFLNQLSPISKISKEASQELQNFQNIEPNLIKKQKLNYFQTPSPKAQRDAQRIDVLPLQQKTAYKITGNKNITYIKIQSPIINVNYQKPQDLEDELNIYKCSENTNLENILPTPITDPQPQQKNQTNEININNPDLSNFVYEFKYISDNKNQRKLSYLKQQQQDEEISDDSDGSIYSEEYDEDDKEFFDEFSLHDSQQVQQQDQLNQNEQKEILTIKKDYENNLTFSNNPNSQQKLENKILKFETFETPKLNRGRKSQRVSSNYHTLNELNQLKTKQQLKQKEKQQQLQQNCQLQLNKALNQKEQQTQQQQQQQQQNSNNNNNNNNLTEEKKRIGCNCKKSRCLKLYCDCFANGLFCTSECNCIDCANKQENEDERYSVMLQLIERNPCAFKPKVDKIENNQQEESHVRGCNCAKSGCIKKYCECYQAGVKCTSLCKCENCKNKDESINQCENCSTNNPEYNTITFSKTTQISNINQNIKKQEVKQEENNQQDNIEQEKKIITKSKRVIKKSTYFLSPVISSPDYKQTVRKTRRRA